MDSGLVIHHFTDDKVTRGDVAHSTRPSVNNPIGVPHAASRYAKRGAAPAGFFAGLWHGFIAPISRFIAIHNPAVRTHETRNTGRPYTLGYKIGSADPFALDR
jgi:hypothetical protein